MATARKKAAPKAAPQPTLVAKNYRLLKYQPLTFTLKVGRDSRLLVFDEEKGYNRAIRHCPNEKSIFVDEQSDRAVVEPIIFLKGLLETKETDTITQMFLEMHPKRGFVFDVIDDAQDAAELADYEEMKLDVKQAIRAKMKEEGGIEELRIIASVLNQDSAGAAKMSPAEIKTVLYDAVDSNVNRFIGDDGDVTIFDDMDIKRQAIAQHAFNSGVITISADGSKVMWSDTKAQICRIPEGQGHLKYFASWLATEEGLDVAREISKR
jgi:hypothetical protein